MKSVCVDSCFLIALYDRMDPWHTRAESYSLDVIEESASALLVPWPALYESISTRMVRRRSPMERIERDWTILQREQRLTLLDDREFRDAALQGCLHEVQRREEHYRNLSLVDRIIRSMLSADNIRVDTFITFNAKDFSDVCMLRGITLVQ